MDIKRRLLPTALAAITIAASAPLIAPHPAHAATQAPREHVRQLAPGKIPTLPRVSATRGMRVQTTSAT